MAKKKKHWSAILKVLGACRGGRRYAGRKESLEEAWRKCPDGWWMSWLCYSIVELGIGHVFMWQRNYDYPAYSDPVQEVNAKTYAFWELADVNADSAIADIVRKFWPKPPRIPKKLLKEAGLL